MKQLALHLLPACCSVFLLLPAAEEPGAGPLDPIEAARRVQAPDGFVTTLFAAEPEVQQPISITFDDRGRVWIAECHTYAGGRGKFDDSQTDRIVILEDSDGDGRSDKRKVFWDGAKHLTSVACGFGGVWALCAPNLLFLPDRNRDDVPDSAPEVILDGFDFGPIGHNVVNGLKWGPDGWLYGRHGIQSTSIVGKPGAPEGERTALNTCIWRFHPTRQTFNVVCQGGTNSWGHDWNEHGQLFWVNTVIGHLWHGIPGAYFKRMYGEHLRPHLYELIDQHADHHHWDTREVWNEIRKGASQTTQTAGGGHAHSGLMVYLGDNWPEQYRGGVFMVNYHGRRLNHDRMERHGSGYVGRHQPDAVQFADPWFRGIDLASGPDGGVLVLDWSDTGECHESDADGAHRENGRVYKITHGVPKKPTVTDVSALDDEKLAELHRHGNEWFVRQARRVLQERVAAGQTGMTARDALLRLFAAEPSTTLKVRALWTLHAMGVADENWLRAQLRHSDEIIRATAMLALTDHGAPTQLTVAELARLAAEETSAFVRLHIAAVLGRVHAVDRATVGWRLALREEDAADHNLPLLIWYALEPAVAADPQGTAQRLIDSRLPLVRQLGSRRIAESLAVSTEPVDTLLRAAAAARQEIQLDVLRGLSAALRGWRKAPLPKSWSEVETVFLQSDLPEIPSRARNLAVLFGDGRALGELRAVALRNTESGEARRAALEQLIEARPADLYEVLSRLVGDRQAAPSVVHGLALFDRPEVPELILRCLSLLNPEDRRAGISALASRPKFAHELVKALKNGAIARSEVSAFHVRQILGYGDASLARELKSAWGEIRSSSEDKTRLLESYRKLLQPEKLAAADPSQGRVVFQQTCGSCHKLFGEGGTVSVELTGSGRADLSYLLENIVDPGAIVPVDLRMSTVQLRDGRVLNGIVVARTERTLTLQTPTERAILDHADVAEVTPSEESLMPAGLLETLEHGKIVNLFAYLQSPRQVPLPQSTPTLPLSPEAR